MIKSEIIIFGIIILSFAIGIYYYPGNTSNMITENKMVELGILGFDKSNPDPAAYSGMQYIYVDMPWYPKYTWPALIKASGLKVIWQSTYTEDPWIYYNKPAGQKIGLTNVNYVKWMFDLAASNKNNYDYGTFMGREELYNPLTLVGGVWPTWTVNMDLWTIDGTLDIAGQHLEALKPWYTRVYGAWNQTWWDGVKGSNNGKDPKVKAWAAEYYFKLHKAWVQHMHNLGKKAAIIGFVFAQPTFSNQMAYYYGSNECGLWVLDNYDFIMQYSYPTCWPSGGIPCVGTDELNRPIDTYINIPEIQWLRSKTRGKLAWNLITEFGGGWKGNKALQFEEYKRVYPYVDVITALWTATTTPTNLMAPRLLEFCHPTNSCPDALP